MAWFVTQSLAVILATFVLGLIVGWLWWGRLWRKAPFGESDAVRAVGEHYRTAIAQRDAELERLAGQTGAEAPSVTSGAVAATSADVAAAGSAADGESTATASPTPDRQATDQETTDGVVGIAGPDAAQAEAESEPEPPQPDDLQRIEGVGPRIATALDNAGLSTYQAVADADEEQLSAALREAGLSFAPSLATWGRQARLLAAADEDGLAALQADLTAGRSHRAGTDQATGTETTGTETTTTEPDSTEPAAEPATGDGSRATAGTAPIATPGTSSDTDGKGDAGGNSDAGPGEDEGDELERVEGIGPRIATALRKAGISTYRELAATDAPTLQAALAASGLRFTPSLPTWSRQAALLAEGDEAGFLALTRTLVPDRETGRPAT